MLASEEEADLGPSQSDVLRGLVARLARSPFLRVAVTPDARADQFRAIKRPISSTADVIWVNESTYTALLRRKGSTTSS